MSAISRLRTAIEDGLIDLPEGRVTFVRPGDMFDIAAVGQRDITICTTSFPDHKRWSDAGYKATTEIPKSDVIVVAVPRSKQFARSLVAMAAEKAQLVIVDGPKTDGIDSIFKACRKSLGNLPSVTKAHGRIFWFDGTLAFADWKIDGPTQGDHGFYTTPGAFSDNGIDKGSALLTDSLPQKLPARVADLGAGWGFLSHAALKRDGVQSIDLFEAEKLALDCAKRNIMDDRCNFIWGDATDITGFDPYDAVIMNPPFHVGREGSPALGQDFIRSAAKILKPQGHMMMVANRHLPYEAVLSDCFQRVEELAGSGGFKILKASRPKR